MTHPQERMNQQKRENLWNKDCFRSDQGGNGARWPFDWELRSAHTIRRGLLFAQRLTKNGAEQESASA